MNTKRTAASTLTWVATCVVIAACAAPSQRGSTGVQPRPTFDDPREEIAYLYDEITSLQRGDGAHMDSPTMTGGGDAVGKEPGTAPQPMSTESPDGDMCVDVCALTDSICDNAQRICRLAEGLAPDEWSAEKCESATSSCELAHERCDDCNGDR